MDYELAEELKDAGFPQTGRGEILDANIDVAVDPNSAYAPTLSELIEACGEGLYVLQRWGSGWKASGENRPVGEGDTPEIAVARLWLALNKK